MKIELKHLSPYLNHDLPLSRIEFGDSGEFDQTMKVCETDGYSNDIQAVLIGKTRWGHDLKPILKPLSDYKDVNSESMNHLGIDLSDQIIISDLANRQISLSAVPYGVFEIMCREHIDFNGLIDKGFAVNINKIN